MLPFLNCNLKLEVSQLFEELLYWNHTNQLIDQSKLTNNLFKPELIKNV
jgi:hypothetical protein